MSPQDARMHRLEITRIFDAPRERVWRAWTEPSTMARWLHPDGLRTPAETVSVDLRVGGVFRFTMIDSVGTAFTSGGEYLELREPELLRCTWGSPDASVAEIEVLLTEMEQMHTRMRFVLRADAHADDAHSMKTGWREAISELGREMGEIHG